MDEKLIVWILFSVLIGLLPILFDAFRAMLKAGGTFSFDEAISRGELTLVTTVLCGAAFGELISGDGNLRKGIIIACGCNLLALLASAFAYTEISATSRAGGAISKPTIRNASIALFVIGLITSSTCVAFSKMVVDK